MFEELKADIEACRYCEASFGFEPRPIFWGNKNAKIVQISQAPSSSVHLSGKPFTDASGKTLREWYQVSEDEFYNQDNFYISAIGHCYPGKDRNGNDRLPPKECFDKWVVRELALLENEIYIVIGARAARKFFPKEKFDDLIFKDNYWNGKLMYVLPHPSPLNRRYLKKYPEFLSKRMVEIRRKVRELIGE